MRFSATGMLLNWAILLLTLIPAVVNGLIPAAAGKEASSVVIGLLGTYSAQGFEDMSQLKLDPYMTPGWQIYDDIIIEQAVQMINANASILPNTTLKLRRFTINDPTEKNGATGSLGFASMVALNISQSKENQDVIAVIGDWKVQQLFIGAQIYSYYNIPMCGIICNTERVDSKTNFKSFFRTRSSGRGYGKHILKFLMARKVSRIGIISDASSRGREESDDTVRELTSNDIEVVVLSYSTDAAYNVGLLQKYDARYILVTTTNRAFLGELYFTGLKSGLVSRRHVWISGNTPYYSSALDYLKLPQSPYNEVAGFVWLYGAPLLNWNGSDYPPTYHHLAKSMRANWPVVKQMSVANLNLDIMTDFLAYHPPKAYMEGAFDCIMTLASGFDKLLRENSSLTPEMLSSRKLQQKLNIPLWQRSGYQGIGNMPLIINDVGSSEIAYYWISVKRLDVNGDPVGNIFLTTGQDGSSTYYENSTTLYGSKVANISFQMRLRGLLMVQGRGTMLC
ncbi:periplasmic binding protein-like I [Obelidium mucronatum]|nr:periplasmic binding protein-like I [Obelidium mucronatum]